MDPWMEMGSRGGGQEEEEGFGWGFCLGREERRRWRDSGGETLEVSEEREREKGSGPLVSNFKRPARGLSGGTDRQVGPRRWPPPRPGHLVSVCVTFSLGHHIQWA